MGLIVTLTFDPSSKTYIQYKPDGSVDRTYTPGEISAHLSGMMTPAPGSGGSVAKLDIKTGVNRGKDQGKKIKNMMPTSEDYIAKKNLEREKDSGKK